VNGSISYKKYNSKTKSKQGKELLIAALVKGNGILYQELSKISET
jgi:hypothetical protein